MNPGFSRFHCAALLAGLVPVLTSPARASNEEEGTLNQIVEMNKKALSAYASLDMETAAKLLLQALDLCKSANLEKHPAAARTHIHLGIVYISDPGHRKTGIAEFRAAIAIDPKIRIAKSLSNPEVQAAFEEALLARGVLANPPVSLPYSARPDQARASGSTASTQALVSRINHPPVTEAFRNKPVTITAHVPPGLGASRVVLAYRAEGRPEFLAREMIPVGGNSVGWFHESIPVEATRGAGLTYYIEARDANDEPIAHSGAPETAHHIALRPEVPAAETAPSRFPRANAGKPSPAPMPAFWFVIAVGTGAGYHSGKNELHRNGGDIKASGFAMAQLVHLAPEIGFFPSDRWVVSVQGRFQFVTGVDDARIDGKTLAASTFAAAGLVKLTRLIGRADVGFRPFLTVQAGAGQIRHSINLPRDSTAANCESPTSSPSTKTCSDTVVGGLGLAGIGTGFTYALNRTFAVYAGFNLITGLPHFMVHGDLSVGLALFR